MLPHNPLESVLSSNVPALFLPNTRVVSWFINALISLLKVSSSACGAISSYAPVHNSVWLLKTTSNLQ